MNDDYVAPSQIGWLGWVGWVAAVAAIIAAIVLGIHDSTLRNQLRTDNGQIAQLTAQAQGLQKLMDALTSPDSQHMTLTEILPSTRPVGHATYLSDSGALIFVASHLRSLPKGKTYELWLIPVNKQAPEPAGLFRPDANGSASVVMPPLPGGVKAKSFRVTIEQGQGSATPTLPIVMAGS